MNKYEIIEEDSILYKGRKLYRIKSLQDFRIGSFHVVSKGQLGGYVQSEANLSQEGVCWITENAKAYDSSRIYDSAQISGEAEVYHYAVVKDSSKCYGASEICETAHVLGNSRVGNYAKISGAAAIEGIMVLGATHITGTAILRGCYRLVGNIYIADNSLPHVVRSDTTHFMAVKDFSKNEVQIAFGSKVLPITALVDDFIDCPTQRSETQDILIYMKNRLKKLGVKTDG